jgi:hypothetical protein
VLGRRGLLKDLANTATQIARGHRMYSDLKPLAFMSGSGIVIDLLSGLDIFELTEFAWHDCYGEVTPPDSVIDDIYVCSQGRLPDLARAARLAVEDHRDLRIWADKLRGQ